MAGTIRMRALVAFEHDGEKLRKGQTFFCAPAFAAAYRYQRKADFIDGATHTREMHAQGGQQPVTAGASSDPSDDGKGRGRGSYRRRDMRAEGTTSSGND